MPIGNPTLCHKSGRASVKFTPSAMAHTCVYKDGVVALQNLPRSWLQLFWRVLSEEMKT